MSVFDDQNSDLINKAFTKENIIQSIVDGYKNGWTPQLYYKEHTSDDKLNSYALLSWTLDESSYLANKDNTAGYQLNHITAMFDCSVGTTSEVATVKVKAFMELEVEHDDSISGVDGEFYVRNNEHLIIEAKDFDEILKKAASERNEDILRLNSLNPLSEKLKTISIIVA